MSLLTMYELNGCRYPSSPVAVIRNGDSSRSVIGRVFSVYVHLTPGGFSA